MPSLRSPPAIEHPDPIAEMTTPPLSDIESGEPIHPHPSSLFYPPKPSHHHPSSSEPSAPKTLRNFVPQVILLGVLFLSSLAVIAALVASLPNLFIPHSVSDLPALTSSLSIYRASSQFAELHLFVVLSALFLWKQCFSIPGSILTNILFGALYGTGAGTSWACLWTAAGSTGAYYIAKTISPLVEHYFATPLAMTRRALNLPLPNEHRPLSQQQPSASTSDLFSHLLLARFFPLLPYSVLNVISGVLGLPVPLFFITLILGSFPFNFATVSIGELVALAASDPSTSIGNKIWSFPVLRKLVLVTVISVLPVVFKKPLQKWAAQAEVGVAVREAMGVARTGCSAVRGSVVRTVGGWMGEVGVGGMVRSGGSPAPAPFFGGGGGGGGGRRQWRHKFNPSWGGDGYRFVESSGSEDGGMLA